MESWNITADGPVGIRLPCGLSVHFPPDSYVEILMPSLMVLRSEVFGPEGGPLGNEISALVKENPQSSLVPSTV